MEARITRRDFLDPEANRAEPRKSRRVMRASMPRALSPARVEAVLSAHEILCYLDLGFWVYTES